jgi:hypothetical protein
MPSSCLECTSWGSRGTRTGFAVSTPHRRSSHMFDVDGPKSDRPIQYLSTCWPPCTKSLPLILCAARRVLGSWGTMSKCLLVFSPTKLTVEIGADLVALFCLQVVALRASRLEKVGALLAVTCGSCQFGGFPSNVNRRLSVRSGWKASFDGAHNISCRTSNVCAVRASNAFEWDPRHSAKPGV